MIARLILMGFLIPALAGDALAQSDAGTVTASVFIVSDAILVTGIQDLEFGTHFASEGMVANEQAAIWQIDVSTDPTNVDLVFTVLPTELVSPGLFTVPLFYDPDSFGVFCAGILIMGEPEVGISNCELSPGSFAYLGDESLPTGLVHADLSAAGEAGVYSATIELTATIN